MPDKNRPNGMLAVLFDDLPNQAFVESVKTGLRELFPIKGSMVESIKQNDLSLARQRRNCEFVKQSDEDFRKSRSTKALVAFNFDTTNSLYAYDKNYDDNPSYLAYFFNFLKNLTYYPPPKAHWFRKIIGVPIGIFFIFWHAAFAIPNVVLGGLKIVAVLLPWFSTRFFSGFMQASFDTLYHFSDNEKKEELGPRIGKAIGAFAVLMGSALLVGVSAALYFLGRAFFTPLEAFKDFYNGGSNLGGGRGALLITLAFVSGLATVLTYVAAFMAAVAILSPIILVVAPEYLPASISTFLGSLLTAFKGLISISPSFFIKVGSLVASQITLIAPSLAHVMPVALMGLAVVSGVVTAVFGMAITALKDLVIDSLHLMDLKNFIEKPHKAVKAFDRKENGYTHEKNLTHAHKESETKLVTKLPLLPLNNVQRDNSASSSASSSPRSDDGNIQESPKNRGELKGRSLSLSQKASPSSKISVDKSTAEWSRVREQVKSTSQEGAPLTMLAGSTSFTQKNDRPGAMSLQDLDREAAAWHANKQAKRRK